MMHCLVRVIALLSIGTAGAWADVVDVQPADSYSTVMSPAGWEPGIKTYRLVNTTRDWVSWQAASVEGTAVCWPRSGWIPPTGSASVEIAPAGFMRIAAPGVYTEEVVIDFRVRVVGDVDGDGEVDSVDLVRMVASFGRNDRACDFDGSGIVDILDLLRLVQNFGRSAGALDV